MPTIRSLGTGPIFKEVFVSWALEAFRDKFVKIDCSILKMDKIY